MPLSHLTLDAFLYDYDGVEGTLLRVKFRPNPSYYPSTYEGRLVHSLAGTILIDSQQKRLVKLSGRLISPVEFAYGLLGHIDNGGTVEIGRVEVGPAQWKTALINLQLSGCLVLFKTITKQNMRSARISVRFPMISICRRPTSSLFHKSSVGPFLKLSIWMRPLNRRFDLGRKSFCEAAPANN